MTEFASVNPTLILATCFLCGGSFWAERSTAQFCCNAHKQRAYRWRAKVTSLKLRAMKAINELAPYLDYDMTTPPATLALAEIGRTIGTVLLEHNVKVVK